MVANDSLRIVASMPALNLGPKAVLGSNASFVIIPGAMLEIWLCRNQNKSCFWKKRLKKKEFPKLSTWETLLFNLSSTIGLVGPLPRLTSYQWSMMHHCRRQRNVWLERKFCDNVSKFSTREKLWISSVWLASTEADHKSERNKTSQIVATFHARCPLYEET